MTHPFRRPRGVIHSTRAILATLFAAALLATPSVALAADDPNLDQRIQKGQPVVHGERTLEAGHVDMGPRFVDGRWTFLIHDDVAKADASATSVWRYPDETVFHLVDAGELTAPDDPAYRFLGAEPGSTVWVSPQTQNPAVVWIGWNTQDPEVMAQIDRGVTLSLHRVQGPGTMTVFLQSGSFGEPQVLWDSRIADRQPVWVDVNTHTHANWAFTAPGVYLIELEASASLIDGSTVSDTQTLRVAVGTGTAPQGALTAAWSGPAPAASATADAAAAPPGGAQDPLVPVLIAAIAVVSAGLVAGTVIVVVRGDRARRRALTGASAPADEDIR